MGKLNEYDGLAQVDVNECITLISSQVNKATELTLSAVPVTYGVYINEDLIYSCNILKNAEMLYKVIRADLAGTEYCGEV